MEQIRIVFQGICKRFAGRELYHGRSGTFSAGCCSAITGGNGAGKSTLLKILAGLVRPTAGTVSYIAGSGPLTPADFRAQMGLVTPEMALYPELTARENLRFFLTQAGKEMSPVQIDALLAQVELSASSEGAVRTFSTGMRQRLKLALLLGADRPVWLLDEPSANLDAAGRALLQQQIKGACACGRTILLATNDSGEVACADEIFRLS